MCGICGYAGYSPDETLLNRMVRVLRHRGPDDEGFYYHETASMGMSRLSIIDVAGGQQPIFHEDQSLALICNGEIYNYRALMKDLINRGHCFKTQSDTETILHLYEDL